MKRIVFTREQRKSILAKTGGHCAYCGTPLSIGAMQIDHVQPLHLGGTNDETNLMPSCRSCNHYKSTLTLEKFRAQVAGMVDVLLRGNATFRNACRFGLIAVKPTPTKIEFFFEREEATRND